MTPIEQDLDFIILKTQQLFSVIQKEEYQLIQSKELVRKQLIEQFFLNYTVDEIATVSEKFQTLVNISKEAMQECEALFEQTKKDIVRFKKISKIKKAYK